MYKNIQSLFSACKNVSRYISNSISFLALAGVIAASLARSVHILRPRRSQRPRHPRAWAAVGNQDTSFKSPPVTTPKTRPRVGGSGKSRHLFQFPSGHNAQDTPARGRQWEIKAPLSSPRRSQRPRHARAWAAVGNQGTSFKSPPVTAPKTPSRVGGSRKYRHLFQVPACHNAQDTPALVRQSEIKAPLSSPRRSQRPRHARAWAAVGNQGTPFEPPPVTTPKTRPRVGGTWKSRHLFQVPAGHNAQDTPTRGRQWEINAPLSSPRRSQRPRHPRAWAPVENIQTPLASPRRSLRPRHARAWAPVGNTDTSFESPPVTTPKTPPRVDASIKIKASLSSPHRSQRPRQPRAWAAVGNTDT